MMFTTIPYAEYKRIRPNTTPSKKYVIKDCVVCSLTFISSKKNKKTCSRVCSFENNLQRARRGASK